ncbi:MAG TPA: glutamate synthase subunit beta [Streptosporangiaceae bacterium]|jgi:glutamate synthase (NADPH/NADH) small chain|nr:glutamate synthase subunit beta [Streptosporangiaceae bacterium]
MANPRGFMTTPRQTPARRPVDVRIRDWREVYTEFGADQLERQAGRCMDCGIPFCHSGCPLGNLIPEWNDLVHTGSWRAAAERLHATNNFPEFTGRLCPAPCESACVLGISADPVTIKQVEVEIIDRAWAEGWVPPRRPAPAALAAGRRVAVIGSGPAGLAAAQQLTRAGHAVTVFERADAPGGLLRYGIPEFKMEKRHLDRRLIQMLAEGTEFRCGVEAGVDISADDLRRDYAAVVLAGGASVARQLPVPGADLAGIHQAMEYLPLANRAVAAADGAGGGRAGDGQESARRRSGEGGAAGSGPVPETAISAKGKQVVIIGGGDTGADCLGTALRQGAISVTQLEILPRPPAERLASQPWPTHPMIFRISSAHEEGGERVYAVSTRRFTGDSAGRVRGLELVEVAPAASGFQSVPGTERELPCDLVLLAMGFTGAQAGPLTDGLGVAFDSRGNIARDSTFATSVPGVFVAGDMGRGQSLIVWAIAEGRSAAAAVDAYLCGATTLPAAITSAAGPLR